MLGDGTGVFQERHALQQRLVPVMRDQRECALRTYLRGQRERIGDDAAFGIAREGELCRLAHVLAENEMRSHLLPQAAMLERFFGAQAIGGMFRICNGEASDSACLQLCREVVHGRVWLQQRAVRDHQHDAAFGIEVTLVPGEAIFVKIVDEFLVGGHEQLEWSALANLGGEIPGRAEGEFHFLAGVGLEGCGNLGDGELQVGSGRDDRHVALGLRALHLERGQGDPGPEAECEKSVSRPGARRWRVSRHLRYPM